MLISLKIQYFQPSNCYTYFVKKPGYQDIICVLEILFFRIIFDTNTFYPRKKSEESPVKKAGQSQSQELSTSNKKLVSIPQSILFVLAPHFLDLFCLNKLNAIFLIKARFSGA